jgi:hypothetical protein
VTFNSDIDSSYANTNCAQYCRLLSYNCFAIHSSMSADLDESVKKSSINRVQGRVLVLSYPTSNKGPNLHYNCRKSVIVEQGINYSVEHPACSHIRRIGQPQTQRTARLVNLTTINQLNENTQQMKQHQCNMSLGFSRTQPVRTLISMLIKYIIP